MMKRSLLAALGVLLLLAAAGGIGWFVYHEHEAQSAAAAAAAAKDREDEQLAKFDDLKRRWDDAIRLAANTPREHLTGPITKLQELRREADAIFFYCDPINGLGTYRAGMDRGIDAFLYHLNHGTGVIEEAGLKWMQERFDVASKALAKACKH